MDEIKTVKAEYGPFTIDVMRLNGRHAMVTVCPQDTSYVQFANMKSDYIIKWWPEFRLVQQTAKLWADSGFDMELGEFLLKTLGESQAS
jgi:hypothetical protein